MKKNYLKPVSVLAASAILFTSCASTTLINTTPVGAKVYLDGEIVGTTPYTHKDTKIIGTTTTIKLEKEGYEPFTTNFTRSEKADVGAIIGGAFFSISLFMDYEI
ncbi:PEGA domain-containing protein [Sphingobacterium sp. HJSM2_6]|uniref:PEGA domain-containing protein n=1 Tax=Sphingobacterium sp. HJSM2_6 TaxID=3366264 RepID=UPI003BBE420B